jgi:hypothetical protein
VLRHAQHELSTGSAQNKLTYIKKPQGFYKQTFEVYPPADQPTKNRSPARRVVYRGDCIPLKGTVPSPLRGGFALATLAVTGGEGGIEEKFRKNMDKYHHFITG